MSGLIPHIAVNTNTGQCRAAPAIKAWIKAEVVWLNPASVAVLAQLLLGGRSVLAGYHSFDRVDRLPLRLEVSPAQHLSDQTGRHQLHSRQYQHRSQKHQRSVLVKQRCSVDRLIDNQPDIDKDSER